MRLVCISEFTGQYAEFSRGMPGDIEITEVLAPGFSGTTLPTSAHEAGQAIIDALQLAESCDQTIIIVGHGITCIPGMQAFRFIDNPPLPSPAERCKTAMVAIAPITAVDTVGIGDDPLVLEAISTHLGNERDLIAYGRYLTFGLRSDGDQPDEKRSLILDPLISDHLNTTTSPLAVEPSTVALRVFRWVADTAPTSSIPSSVPR